MLVMNKSPTAHGEVFLFHRGENAALYQSTWLHSKEDNESE